MHYNKTIAVSSSSADAQPGERRTRIILLSATLIALVIVALLFAPGNTLTAFAQEATVEPITVDTSALTSGINDWVSALDDVFFFIAGISVAVALLTFIIGKLVAAFRGGGIK